MAASNSDLQFAGSLPPELLGELEGRFLPSAGIGKFQAWWKR